MPERLLEAVNELTQVVKSLERTLKADYPKRSEILRRRNIMWLQMFLVVIIAIIGGYFVTIGTISGCFLGDAANGLSPRFCNVLPGYHDAQVKNRKLIKEFEVLVKRSERNAHRITRLEHRTGIK